MTAFDPHVDSIIPGLFVLHARAADRPKSNLVIDHYRRNLGWYTRTAPLFRMWLKRLPPEDSLRITARLVRMALPWYRRTAGIPIARNLVPRIFPVLCYYGILPLNEKLQYEWSLLDTHDSLTDWYKHWRSCGEIEETLRSLGGEQIAVMAAGYGIEARMQRPAARA